MDHLNEKNNHSTQVVVLRILTAIFKCEDLREYWRNFVELLTLRVLEANCHEKREV